GRPGGSVRFWRCDSERAQAQAVAGEVERLLREGAPPERVGVLVGDVRVEGQAVSLALEERAVPHRLVGAGALFQRAEVRDVLLGHLEHLHAFYGEPAGVRIARKHLGWYAKDRPEHTDAQRYAFRAVVNRAETAEAQLRLTRDYFDALIAGARPGFQAAA
ncbi:MAG: hypothetical protein KY442_13725, partial [Proteobacteria bacterium]|nr:hypothetical protein [Pseudomonadota bacterium]